MSEESVLSEKAKGLYKTLCQSEWNATVTGVIVGFLSVMIMAWWRPWGAVGAIRNWGDWIMYGVASVFGSDAGILALYEEAPRSIFVSSGSVIGLGFVLGAFISACLGKDFALRVPPYREWVKAVIAGILMGIGASLAGGCNVGGFYNAIGNLSASGFAMMFGLVFGVVLGLKLLYVEMEHISWGDGGSKTFSIPTGTLPFIGIAAIVALVAGAYAYAGNEDSDYIASLSGVLVIAAALGYAMQRGRWCMVQGFREPHMTGDCTMAKSVMLSIMVVAVGAAVLKYAVPMRAEGEAVLATAHYVRGTFGWGGVVGGFLFGLGAMFAGGCGSGTLWRVGEGQVKLMMVVPFFAISNSIVTAWFKDNDFEADGVLGSYVYLPDVMGYGPTLLLIGAFLVVWYLVVTWNEDTNKLIVPM
ncbi:YeeE/YedE thiosulfate transporter family protein [Desulfopila sp. IMCC35008]|uniref:YeeE/YedE thiosulfate transporter family protein n=1 Tax=Desulfopila sp. IMCC35008 TaxID=2653858 RepID=UPI0013D05D36|nr:YeeE/YedE thiosulfate transporter family protein [Desulfopila sp. IMCC35008]